MAYKNTITYSGLDARISKSNSYLIIQQKTIDEIEEGKHFFVSDFDENVASGTSVDFGFTTPNSSKEVNMFFNVEGNTQTSMTVFEGATISGSNTATAINNNRKSTNTSDSTVIKNPTISGASPTSGNRIFADIRGKAGATPSKATNLGILTEKKGMVLKSGTTYLYEIKSFGDGNDITYKGEWSEKIPKSD